MKLMQKHFAESNQSNRMIVTQKGQEIQKSLQEDIELEEHFAQRQKRELVQRSKTSTDESTRAISQIFEANTTLRMMEGVSKKVQIVLSQGSKAPEQIVDMFVEENRVSRKDMSPYLLQKISKMTEDVCNNFHQPSGGGRSHSIKFNSSSIGSQSSINLSYLGQSSLSIHQGQQSGIGLGGGVGDVSYVSTRPNPPGIRFPPKRINKLNHSISSQIHRKVNSSMMSNNNSNTSMNMPPHSLGHLDDSELIDKCNVIVNCEAKVDRIMKRYRNYQNSQKQIDAQVRRACEAKRDLLLQENLRPPKQPHELREENDDTYDIINKQDNYEQTKKARVLQTMKEKYSKVWSNAHVPELTEKYKRMFGIDIGKPVTSATEKDEQAENDQEVTTTQQLPSAALNRNSHTQQSRNKLDTSMNLKTIL